VYLVGAVGAADGRDSVQALAASAVDVSMVRRCVEPTGHAVVQVAGDTGENQIAVAPGANAVVSADDVDAALRGLELGPADVVVLSCELPALPLRVAADLTRRAGGQLVVNPAPADPGCLDLLTGAVATPNEHELAVLTAGAGRTPAEAALALSDRTGGPVVVTLGARGALLADSGRVASFAAHEVAVRDTTGAGDTLTGVLAASLAQGHELHMAVRRAVAAAALAVTRDGARAGMPAAAEIDRLLAR
jgi:ribokinase